jgi:hypothetical protein
MFLLTPAPGRHWPAQQKIDGMPHIVPYVLFVQHRIPIECGPAVAIDFILGDKNRSQLQPFNERMCFKMCTRPSLDPTVSTPRVPSSVAYPALFSLIRTFEARCGPEANKIDL